MAVRTRFPDSFRHFHGSERYRPPERGWRPIPEGYFLARFLVERFLAAFLVAFFLVAFFLVAFLAAFFLVAFFLVAFLAAFFLVAFLRVAFFLAAFFFAAMVYHPFHYRATYPVGLACITKHAENERRSRVWLP